MKKNNENKIINTKKGPLLCINKDKIRNKDDKKYFLSM